MNRTNNPALARKLEAGDFHKGYIHNFQGKIVHNTDGMRSVRPDGTRVPGVDLDFLEVVTVIVDGRKPYSEGVEAPETAQ